MSRIRMFEGEEPGTPSPRTTIVGGRPPEEQAATAPVPTGLQRLLRLAAVNPAFLEELVARRTALAEVAGVPLTASESAILAAVPEAQLRAMARAVPPPEPTRRDFLRKTAATAVVLLGGAALEGCPPGDSEPAPTRPTVNLMAEEGGAAPDEPPPRPEHVPSPPGGARPDEPPPPRPDRSPVTDGIRPDPGPPPPSPTDGGFAEPPAGWEGARPDGGCPDGGEPAPPRPEKPHSTRGSRPR
jgi:hypothetical protein